MASRVLETGTGELLTEIDQGVAILTLNRPERRNALSDSMLEALAAALEACETDHEVRCVVLTGAGGAFCAGGDVKAFAEEGTDAAPSHERLERQRRFQRATAGRLHAMAKPTIACVDGAAAGAGLGLALACDLRIASEASVFVTAFARVGLSGDYGATWFLTRMLGTAKALELLMFSPRMSAAQASETGLVNRVVPAGEALKAALDWGRALAAGPAVALSAIKGNVLRAVDHDLPTCMDLEVNEIMRCAETDDHAAAVAAFAAKRAPVFQGR
ncbi:enoyl-CoA hydratase-related protein [Planotetraspora kaengkrachanensis]|uniref:Enoyl-CoA hydratase n=1 Tax=Planotetraspora kaengkrachanensis TaxID=575193 RepID=A0A8J3M3Z2_9ACTN|nr:enoyl-CoA hydratase-related protein [Planotetraspora kaengkrachanensis]GIG78666.1 enoyl-CoA hydratase [Planotetraspora kaengkrachanensis]